MFKELHKFGMDDTDFIQELMVEIYSVEELAMEKSVEFREIHPYVCRQVQNTSALRRFLHLYKEELAHLASNGNHLQFFANWLCVTSKVNSWLPNFERNCKAL